MGNRSQTLRRIARVVLAMAVLGLLLSNSRSAQAQSAVVDIPKTPAGEQFAAWYAAFNSGDKAELEKFRSHFDKPEEHKVEGVFAFRQQTGGFDLRKIEESSATKLTGLVQERDSDQFARFSLEVEPAAPYHVTRIDLRAVERPAEFAIPRLSQSDLLDALRGKLQKDVAADKFAGAVLLAKDGKAIFTGAYGLADREKKIPNYAHDEIPHRLDEQDVHCRLDSPARASRKDFAGCARGQVHHGLSEQRRRD